MNHASRLIAVTTMAALVCNGCATKALIKAANEPGRQKYPGIVRLVSASSDGRTAYLCFHRTARDTDVETYQARIPVAGNRDFYVSANGYRQPVLKIATDQLSPGVCEAHGESMPVIEISDQNRLSLGAGQKEAVYVKYADGLQSLGYVSASPFYNRGISGDATYSYAIDMERADILSSPGQKRSYLLMLLPLTVAADVVTGVGVGVFAIAYSVAKGCGNTPGGCKGGS